MSSHKKTIYEVSSPVRADLAGGTLDLWPLYCFNSPAKTINIALDLKAKAKFEFTPSEKLKLEVKAFKETFQWNGTITSWDSVPAPVRFPVFLLHHYLQQKKDFSPFELSVSVSTEAPLKSGLGGSSALAVTVLRGISRYFNDFSDSQWQWKLMEWVRDAEAAFLHTATGVQDYLAAIYGGINCFTFQIGSQTQKSYSKDLFQSLSDHLIVLFSGEMHDSGASNWEIFKKNLEKDPVTVSGIEKIAALASALDEQFSSGHRDWSEIGKIISEEWKIRREVFSVNTERIDSIIAFLKSENVLGAKVCGAANGGSLIALVEPEAKKDLIEKCAKQGLQVLRTNPTQDGVKIVD